MVVTGVKSGVIVEILLNVNDVVVGKTRRNLRGVLCWVA